MKPPITIRGETAADVNAITEVTVAAFKTLAVSNQTEQFIIAALRAANALTISLVAEVDGRVVGHIAFSLVTISDGTAGWYGLGPVSVLPQYQRQGIGSALIQEGLARLQALGAKGCCLVGHPTYYPRFGFQNPHGLVLPGVPATVFFALVFDGPLPQGMVAFHPAFQADGQPHTTQPLPSAEGSMKVEPDRPEVLQRPYRILDLNYVSLYLADLPLAVTFFTRVLGSPESSDPEHTTYGWRMGATWLTLLPSRAGSQPQHNPQNTEFALQVATPAEVDALHHALIEAGAQEYMRPHDTAMYEPMRFACVDAPFGVRIDVYCRLAATDRAEG